MIKSIALKAKKASAQLACAETDTKNSILIGIADALVKDCDDILIANSKDIEMARLKGMKESLIDRLLLTEDRIKSIADAIRKIADLNDPVGKAECFQRPNGLKIIKKQVPLGVVGVIYEARPNVTADVAAICVKTGNAVVLKGGSDAINSNKAIVSSMKKALNGAGVSEDIIMLIENTDRESTNEMMKLNGIIDVLIPRGGAGLIKQVVENATVPVIETGTGNCHIFVDEFADIEKAVKIVLNAKTQRTGVCNAAESLVIHKNIASKVLPNILTELNKAGVEIFGCAKTCKYADYVRSASEEDYYTEYLDMKISVIVKDSIYDAITHINEHSTGHSEAIITENYNNAMMFTEQIDSAAVYVNASTRFTDGGEFGFGAEIGISTQKLHARGPMGLEEMTTYKYIVLGNGEIRE